MVIKTIPCFYSEMKIYPGRGLRFARKDGKLLIFLNQKSRSMYSQNIKAQRLKWSQAYRRKVKKVSNITAAKKKVKKQAKALRSISGMTLDELNTKRLATHRSHRRDQARASKLKAKTATKTTTKKTKVKTSRPKVFVKQPKFRQRLMHGRTQ